MPWKRRESAARFTLPRRPTINTCWRMFIDDGPAISPEDMPHIFEPFYTTKQHGTGLGLAISHNVIQQQGGALTAENVTNDRGVMFVVKLPLVQGNAAADPS